MTFGPALGASFSWATAANGTTARSAPANTILRTLNMGSPPFHKWSPAVAARDPSIGPRETTTPTFDIPGEYSPRRQKEEAWWTGKSTETRQKAHVSAHRPSAVSHVSCDSCSDCAMGLCGFFAPCSVARLFSTLLRPPHPHEPLSSHGQQHQIRSKCDEHHDICVPGERRSLLSGFRIAEPQRAICSAACER